MHWLVIDPGSNGTGLAHFKEKKLRGWANITSSKKNWDEKTTDICIQVHRCMYKKPEKVYIEWPTSYFIGRGNTDSIIKLAFLVGRLTEIWKTGVTLIPVQAWRGSAPKEIGWKRAEKYFGVKGLNSHAGDAVGIGMYVITKGLYENT